MIILSLVIASKRVVLRGVKSPFLVDEDDEKANAEDRNDVPIKWNSACEHITEEEFDYQSTVTTKKEILKLVNSQAYQRAMREKARTSLAGTGRSTIELKASCPPKKRRSTSS